MARFHFSDYPAKTVGQVRPHPLNPASTRSHRGWGLSAWVHDNRAEPASESRQPSPSATKRRPTSLARGTLGLGSQVHLASSFSALARSQAPQKGNLAYAHSPLGGVSGWLADGPSRVLEFSFFSLSE